MFGTVQYRILFFLISLCLRRKKNNFLFRFDISNNAILSFLESLCTEKKKKRSSKCNSFWSRKRGTTRRQFSPFAEGERKKYFLCLTPCVDVEFHREKFLCGSVWCEQHPYIDLLSILFHSRCFNTRFFLKIVVSSIRLRENCKKDK